MNVHLISISVFISLIPSQDAEILNSPINTAVLKGKAVEFECRTNDGSSLVSGWTFTPIGASASSTIYHQKHGRLSNSSSLRNSNSTGDNINVSTESVNMEDAGLYQCNIEHKGATDTSVNQRSAQLIVLESDPICNISNRRLTCSVEFRGNWAPVMEWKRDSPNGTLMTDGVQSVTNNESITSSLTISEKESCDSDHRYVCRTFFVSSGNSKTKATADNVPNYTYIYNWSGSGKCFTSEASSQRFTTTPFNGKKTENLINIIIGTGVVVCVLVVLLVFVSIRNFKKYSRDSIRPREIEMIHVNPEPSLKRRASSKSEILGLQKIDETESFFSGKSNCSRKLSDSEQQEFRRKQFVGADGTVYMEMGTVEKLNSLPKSVLYPSRYETVLYASIDHTIKPLAPPPNH